MSNQVATTHETLPALPADVMNFFQQHTNIVPKETTPTLSYEGKMWTIGLNGEKQKLMKRPNTEGDIEPVSVMRAVILDYNKQRGRAYYEGAYDPAKVSMPRCWSDDGVLPDPHVQGPVAADGSFPGPISKKCGDCPLAMKGSKVTEQGKSVKACGEHRMVVVVPAHDVDFQPLRMKIAITSDWDGESPDAVKEGWFGFKNYTDMLLARQVPHTAMVVTKMRFDPNVAYPKVQFGVDKHLVSPGPLDAVIAVMKTKAEEVKALAKGTWTPNGIDGTRLVTQQAEVQTTTAVAPDMTDQVLAEVAAKKAALTKLEEETAVANEVAKAKLAETAAAEKAAAKAAKKAIADEAARVALAAVAAAKAAADEDDDEAPVLPGKAPAAATSSAPATQAAATVAAPSATPSSSEAPSNLKALLKDWE